MGTFAIDLLSGKEFLFNKTFGTSTSGTTESAWGGITGTITNQIDLINLVNTRVSNSVFTGYTATTNTRINVLINDYNFYNTESNILALDPSYSAYTNQKIWATVASEGGLDPTGIFRTVKRETSLAINTGIFRPVLAIRLKPGGSIGTIILENISILNASKSDFFFCVKLYAGNELVNVSATPTSWSSIAFTNLSNSFCQYKNDFDTTYVVNETVDNGLTSYGTFISSTTSASVGSIKSSLHIGAKINGVSDLVVIEVKSLTANDTYYASLTFREL